MPNGRVSFYWEGTRSFPRGIRLLPPSKCGARSLEALCWRWPGCGEPPQLPQPGASGHPNDSETHEGYQKKTVEQSFHTGQREVSIELDVTRERS